MCKNSLKNVESFVYWTVHHCSSWRIKDQLDVTCYFYFTSYLLNMFQTLIYPSSGACDYSVELPHCASACNTDTTPTQPYRNSNTHQTKNNTTNVVIQQNSRKILMMDILMSEKCWAHKKWNKIASDIRLVFYSSTINVESVNNNVLNVIILDLFLQRNGTYSLNKPRKCIGIHLMILPCD